MIEQVVDIPKPEQPRQSHTIGKLALALSKAQAKFPIITKSSLVDFTHNGKQTKYSYADLALFVEATRKPLAENELAVLNDTWTTPNGIAATTKLMHSSGEWVESRPMVIRPSDNKPQSIGSASTYARRYSQTGFLNLASSTDDDDAAAAADRAPSVFTGTKDQMTIITELFNQHEIHKDDRKKLTDWIISTEKHADDKASLEVTVAAAAKKIKANEGSE